jgi:hypothetical protein
VREPQPGSHRTKKRVTNHAIETPGYCTEVAPCMAHHTTCAERTACGPVAQYKPTSCLHCDQYSRIPAHAWQATEDDAGDSLNCWSPGQSMRSCVNSTNGVPRHVLCISGSPFVWWGSRCHYYCTRMTTCTRYGS